MEISAMKLPDVSLPNAEEVYRLAKPSFSDARQDLPSSQSSEGQSKLRMSITTPLLQFLALATVMLVFAFSPATAQEPAVVLAGEQDTTTTERQILPVRTDSPRHTLNTFLSLRDSAETALLDYRAERSADGAALLSLLSAQFRSLIDLSQVPGSSREDVGTDTFAYLLDTFGRIEMPNLDEVPDEEAFADDGPAQYRIPTTPIRISRIDGGAREGEFLFNSRTVSVAPRFYQAVKKLPLRSRLEITSWSAVLPQLTGPLIPSAVVLAMPRSLWSLWLGTPIWKVIATILVALIAALLLVGLHRLLLWTEPDTRVGTHFWRLFRPISIIAVVGFLIPFVDRQINTSGAFATVVDMTMTALIYFTSGWLFWHSVRLFVEWILLSPHIVDESLDANLLRLLADSVGVVGLIIIVAFGGHDLGLPIFSMVAGLGIGGLAFALAIRPTLENLIGGVVLYLDKPVRVGDFCNFGAKNGTVESIGLRSTKLRALDRTLITVPNAQFADLEIVNWAQCDEMLINETIGVRYETTPDQLRYVLAKLREMFHAHPRINSETIRVRFSGYGDSSLNITIRVYAMTREWNDYHAIREDIFLRVYDVANEAGTGFAFSSHTIYMGKDSGIDEEVGKKAMEQVRAWRRSGKLPFPRFSPERLKSIDDTLDYPPNGSTEAGQEDLEAAAGSERLSAEPLPETQPIEEADGQEENKVRGTKDGR
jgi:MscS family membrane protein